MNNWIKRLNVIGLGTLLTVTAAGAAPLLPLFEEKPTLASWSLPWQRHGLFGVGRPAVATDLTHRLQAFARIPVGRASTLSHVRQSGKADPPWLPWESLGGSLDGDPIVGKSWDGRLEVFARGPGGSLQHVWQTDGVNDKWSSIAGAVRLPWETLGSVSFVGNPAVASNADGRLEVFVAVPTGGTELSLWHIRQVYQSFLPIPGFYRWSGWESLGGHLLGEPVVERNKDGRLEVFARAAGNNLAHIWQTSANSSQWSAWDNLGGGGLAGNPAVGVNADGRLEVFTRAVDKLVWHIWRTGTSNFLDVLHPRGWSSWERLGSRGVVGDPVVARDLDGRLEVFVRAPGQYGDSMWSTRQKAWYTQNPPTDTFFSSWSNWEDLGGQLSADPVVGTNWDGRLEAFCLALDGGVYHMWQQPAIQWVLGSTERLTMKERTIFQPGGQLPDDRDRIPEGDIGHSLMHNGKLYIFLDDWVLGQADLVGALTPSGGASVAFQGLDFAPDRDASKDFAGFDYRLNRDPFSSVLFLNTLLGPRILGPDQGAGGGFSYDGRVYVFGYVRFLNPTPLIPSWVPSPYPNHADDKIAQGHSMLASAVNPWGPYDFRFAMGPNGVWNTHKFDQVAPVLVKNAEIPLLPRTDSLGRVVTDAVIMLGQGGDGESQSSGMYLAWMPLRPGSSPDPLEMRFYTANGRPPANETPYWSKGPGQAKQLFPSKYNWSSISMGRIRGTGKWIVLYQKTLGDVDNEPPYLDELGGGHPEKRHDGIYARIGTTPWDWSPEVQIFDPDREQAWGKYIIDEKGAFPYGAALLNPYTNWDAANKTVTIQYLLSTQHPYGVVLMRSQIRINN